MATEPGTISSPDPDNAAQFQAVTSETYSSAQELLRATADEARDWMMGLPDAAVLMDDHGVLVVRATITQTERIVSKSVDGMNPGYWGDKEVTLVRPMDFALVEQSEGDILDFGVGLVREETLPQDPDQRKRVLLERARILTRGDFAGGRKVRVQALGQDRVELYGTGYAHDRGVRERGFHISNMSSEAQLTGEARDGILGIFKDIPLKSAFPRFDSDA